MWPRTRKSLHRLGELAALEAARALSTRSLSALLPPAFARRLWVRHRAREKRGAVRPSGHLPRWAFLRLLGLTYLGAFASALVQVRGLVGQRGVLPVRSYLEFLRSLDGRSAYLRAPTLLWLRSSDRALVGSCIAGLGLSCALVAGLAPIPVLAALWALYLSLDTGGQDFLRYQWDALLLESGVVAVLYAPPGLRPRLAREPPPSPAAIWLLRWLLFRVVFSSGASKLASRDRTWRAATALRYHFETQPLPTPLSWYAHHLPRSILRAGVYGVWLTEVLVPPLGLGTRRMRQVAFGSTLALQALIAATGNYGFFNLLTVSLAFPLLDDAAFPRRARARLARGRRPWPPAALAAPSAAALVALSALPLAQTFRVPSWWPARVVRLSRRLAPLQLANPYGLFADMTTERPEIVIEGSDDLREWVAYEYRWKPGNPGRPPRFTGLHLPRLDWQLWFAALAPETQLHWLMQFLARLLEGSREVRRLLAPGPFQEVPPRFVRARVYAYRFSSLAERRASGAWWTREFLYDLVPGVSLGRGADASGGSGESG